MYKVLLNGKVLMGACLLRNTYEEILYIMATTLNISLDINIMTKAGYFKEKLISELKSFKVEKNNIDLTIKQISKEIDKQLLDMNYLDKVNEILNS